MGDEINLSLQGPDIKDENFNEVANAEDFDPVAYINKIFPDEESLSELDGRIKKLKVRIRKLDNEILGAVRSQSSSASYGRHELDEAKVAIVQLFERMESIGIKAEKSEKIVQEICRDIKTLDYAKKHLQMTIAALRRMHMYISFIDQLKEQIKNNLYEEAAQSLMGIEILREYFEPYRSVEKVNDVHLQLEELRKSIKKQIMDDFSVLHESRTNPPRELADECLVIDALGSEAKHELITWFAEIQLAEYRMQYSLNSEEGKLSKIDRRYAWLWRFLRLYEGVYLPIFPRKWRMDEKICEIFALDTMKNLRELLDQQRGARMNVPILLHALQATVEFEGSLSTRFAVSTPLAEGDPPINFIGMISYAFEPYLSHYIDAESEKLSEFYNKSVIKKEGWEATDIGTGVVYSSCNELFVYIKQMKLRCSSLTKGKYLLDLSRIIVATLDKFADFIERKIPSDPQPRYLQRICILINTAEYAEDVTKQFGDSLSKDLSDDVEEQLDVSAAVDKFADVSATAVKMLLNVLDAALKEHLDVLIKTRWSDLQSVDAESEYVPGMMVRYQDFMEEIHDNISEKYFRFVVDKVTSRFIMKFAESLAKLKFEITGMGIEQLLLDSATILKHLLSIEILKGNRIYEKLVTREFDRMTLALQQSLVTKKDGDDGSREPVKYASLTSVRNIFTKLSLS